MIKINIYIGCAGWLYEDWKRVFYPDGLRTHNYLSYYSKFFDLVEINSTFYKLPTKETVSNWYERVPETFQFIVKMWQEVTHKLNNPEILSLQTQFFERIEPLKDKIYAILFQFPPWLHYSQISLDQVNKLVKNCLLGYNYVLEFRHNSWFKESILNQISDGQSIVIGTSYLKNLIPYYKSNQNKYYIRLIADRQLKVFNRVQRENKEEISDLLQVIKSARKDANIYEIFIIVNNHYTGFAPETVNSLKEKLNLSFKNFSQQKKMSDYF